MKLLEIQSSHVGIGKSFFCNSFDLPTIDDCIDLVNCFPESWYDIEKTLFVPEKDDLVKALLILENTCTKLDQLAKSGCQVALSSRSMIVSTCQFLCNPTDESINILYNYFRKRTEGILSSIVVFDYGDVIQKDYWLLGYERMLKRNRSFEVNFFDSPEKYHQFFQECEMRKYKIVEKIKRDPLFTFIPIKKFEGFTFQDKIPIWRESLVFNKFQNVY